jgi:hypothetical protein
MDDKLKLPEPLFFTVIKPGEPGTTVFVNASHVMRIEIDAVQRKSGTLFLSDGSALELGANEADWIMRLMAAHSHQQMLVVSELKRLNGER